MHSTTRQKAKARKSRETDMMPDFDNLDVMMGNENINPIERELADAFDQSSIQGDIESNMYQRNEHQNFTCENSFPRQNDVRDSFENLLK